MTTEAQKYRLLTRSDFDGLVCAILLNELGILGDIEFVHPKDVQDGKVEVTDRDILTNLPYVEGCFKCFDHHLSEEARGNQSHGEDYLLEADAASTARIVYNYYGGVDRFSNISLEMMAAVDRADSAQFSREDVLNPGGWELLSFLMDARTGLGRFREFRVSNYQLMMDLIEYCRDHSVEQILALPDVRERVALYESQAELMKEQVRRCTTVHGNLAVLDLRNEETIFAGNRFIIYALFPECSLSMHVLWGKQRQNTVFAIGKSIFDRSSTVNIGKLALEYGGGGHEAAGTCQIDNADAARIQEELIERLTADAAVGA